MTVKWIKNAVFAAMSLALRAPTLLAQEKWPGFALIPAGQFEMGDHHGFVDPKHGGDETPIHTVRLDAFYMGISTVTTKEYCEFLNSALAQKQIPVKLRHACNSGGFLDLPQAHLDMVRVGILLYGVFPSTVCRQIPGIEPVMSVKAKIAAIQKLKPGEVVGYGMRYTAPGERRIAILPIGYGDGFPRVRNEGCALIHGKRAPLIGGIAMDALMVDITDIPQAQMWDEAVLMGKQGGDEITVRDLAKLKNSVTYDVLTNWRLRLRRKSVNGNKTETRISRIDTNPAEAEPNRANS